MHGDPVSTLPIRPYNRMGSATATAVCLVLIAPASAQLLGDRFDFHGYGYQNYMQTDGNTYLGAGTHGSWDDNFLGLVLAATISDRAKLWAQLEASSLDTTHFTWFFVDYQFTDTLSGHVGRVKLPLGFYNEIIDAKNLQVSLLEPLLYQSALDFEEDSYQGVGLDYEQKLPRGHLTWQLYGGNTYDPDPPTNERDRGLIGARVTYTSPVNGLRFMVSAARVRDQTQSTHVLTNEDRLLLSAEYVTERLDLKSEWGTHTNGSAVVNSNGTPQGIRDYAYYAQFGYRVGSHWEPYLRYDYATTNVNQDRNPSYYQRTGVVGIGYQFTQNLIARLEDHISHGYALPVASGEVAPGAGKSDWNLTVAGLTFEF